MVLRLPVHNIMPPACQPKSMTDIELLSEKIDRLESTVEGLERSILEIRVALLGGLDGRPGLLSQIASINNDVANVRNQLRFVDAKLETNSKDIAGVQREGWLMQGKLIGGGGILGVALSELIKWFSR